MFSNLDEFESVAGTRVTYLVREDLLTAQEGLGDPLLDVRQTAALRLDRFDALSDGKAALLLELQQRSLEVVGRHLDSDFLI